MTNPSSGTTSEMHHHHRESSANAAQAGSEPEQQQRLIEDPAAYLGSRSRKTSADDYPSNNLSNPAGVPNPKEDAAAGAMGSAQETRPRTTTLSSMSESEAAASVRASSSSSSSTSSITSTAANTAAIPTSAPTSHFYGPFAASGDPAAPSTDLDSEPSTPLAAAAAAAPTAPSACERDEASSAAQPGLHREHRPAPLQLSQKFHSTSQVHVASARQTAHHAGTRTGAKPSSPLRQKLNADQDAATTQAAAAAPQQSHQPPQSAVSASSKTHRRSRSSSLPLPRDRSEGKSRRRRTEKNSVDWTSSASPTSPTLAKPGGPSQQQQPLSQFQLLALHQLNLPRPTYLSSNSSSSSRLWPHSTHKRGQHGHHAAPNANLYAPSLSPPIGLATLKELDLGEILRNPQLRHDIVFDPNLVFRPNFDGTRGQKKIEASERYWSAVEREITLGCRCTVFNDAGDVLPCVCPGDRFAAKALDQLCNTAPASRQWGQRRSLRSLPIAARLPSRIAPLVSELRSILLSLLPTPASSPVFTPPGGGGQESPGSYAFIESALDPDLIRQEVEHGVLDVGNLARFLGETLRMHCAPMRDDMVDLMVSLIAGDDGVSSGEHIAQGLQMAFEILELMKLDIANHQLRTLRPYLLETALEFELRGCLDFAERARTSAFTKTHGWLNTAAARTNSRQSFKVVTDGLLQSIFYTEGFDAVKWDRHAANIATKHTPETLQLDLHRIRLFHSDVMDLTVVYMLLMLFRSLVGAHVPDAELDHMAHDIWVLSQANKLVRASSPADASSMPSAASLSRISKLDAPAWREGMSDVLLQIAARADTIKNKKADMGDLAVPDQSTLAMLKGWMDTNLRPTAPLFQLLHKRLRASLQSIVNIEYGPKAGSASSSWWTRSVQPPEAAGTSSLPIGLNIVWGQCSRAARLLDVPIPLSSSASGHSASPSSRSRKRQRDEDRDDDEACSSAAAGRKRRRMGAASLADSNNSALLSEGEGEADVEAVLRRNGLYCLRHELQSLADRVGKVAAFNVEVWDVLYTQILHS